MEKTIQVSAAMLGLPRFDYYFFTREQNEGAGMVQIYVREEVDVGSLMSFRLDMETLEVERLPDVDCYAYPIEFPWPPLRACCTQHST